MKRRISRLAKTLPERAKTEGPLNTGDLQFLENLDHVYGDGGSMNWRGRYPIRADLDREFETALDAAYSRK